MRNKCTCYCNRTLKSKSLYCYAMRKSNKNLLEGDQVVELLFVRIELKCDAILTLLWRHAIVNCNTLGCGRYRVIIFSMVIWMPKENASKTTNVGLYVNLSIVINSLRWHHIINNMIFINLFTKLMNDSEKHDWMFWCDVCKGTCVCCIEMSFVGYVCNVNCMCVLL